MWVEGAYAWCLVIVAMFMGLGGAKNVGGGFKVFIRGRGQITRGGANFYGRR